MIGACLLVYAEKLPTAWTMFPSHLSDPVGGQSAGSLDAARDSRVTGHRWWG